MVCRGALKKKESKFFSALFVLYYYLDYRTMKGIVLCGAFALLGCAYSFARGGEVDLSVVQNIEVDRYFGTWYEIARLDNAIERGLDRVTAEYLKNPDGTVTIINRGYKQNGKLWSAEGTIRLPAPPVEGKFKAVYFLWFSMTYYILELDTENYSYALVGGPSADNLWILSRTPTLPPEVLGHLLQCARQRGFDVEKLYYCKQAARP